MPILEITNVNAGYKDAHILHSVSLAVEPGEFVALIGPNGAGKSTVLKAVYGLARVFDGAITFDGRDVTKFPTHALLEEGIAYVPQGRVVFPSLNVKENLLMGAYLLKDKQVIAANLQSVFDRFPMLREKQKAKAGDLSGGQQQQLAIGRALMMSPRMIMLDEPSLGLSPILQTEVFQKLKELQASGITILCVEQNVRLVLRYADRGYLLANGQIRLSASSEELGRPEVMERAYLR